MSQAIVWFRRDLRLADNPALQAALDAGHAPIPLYVHAPAEDAPWQPGGASCSWLARSLRSLDADLRKLGSRLVIRSGNSLAEIEKVIEQTGAEAVYWNRLYEPAPIARDTWVKDALKARGLHVESSNAALLVEPWTIATLGGEPYRVFTPFWKNASARVAGQQPTPRPACLPQVPDGLESLAVDALDLEPAIAWDKAFWTDWQPGEAGAAELLEAFVEGASHGYKEQRNFPDRIGTSRLSPHLHFGEISPRQIARHVLDARKPVIPEIDLGHYLSELGWREFSHHLLFHYPHTTEQDLSPKFARFRWAQTNPELLQRCSRAVPACRWWTRACANCGRPAGCTTACAWWWPVS